MKKKSIINLIKYYAEKNDVAFKDEAYEIAKDFEEEGDSQLGEYIVSVLSNTNTFFCSNVRKRVSIFKIS